MYVINTQYAFFEELYFEIVYDNSVLSAFSFGAYVVSKNAMEWRKLLLNIAANGEGAQ